MSKTLGKLIMEYFRKHPYEDLTHAPVVDWVTPQWLKEHESPPRDPWREIRRQYQLGNLIKVKRGVYRYEPEYVHKTELEDFPPDIKKAILERDGYRCLVCGRGEKDGVTLVVDHIKPKDKGGTNDISNGQTLCMEHNLIKKNYSQTEAGKKYIIKMYEKAVKNRDEKMIQFCKSIFNAYNKFDINSHISRPNNK